jgi:hypothetical protein
VRLELQVKSGYSVIFMYFVYNFKIKYFILKSGYSIIFRYFVYNFKIKYFILKSKFIYYSYILFIIFILNTLF